jgi:hypothetical protein
MTLNASPFTLMILHLFLQLWGQGFTSSSSCSLSLSHLNRGTECDQISFWCLSVAQSTGLRGVATCVWGEYSFLRGWWMGGILVYSSQGTFWHLTLLKALLKVLEFSISREHPLLLTWLGSEFLLFRVLSFQKATLGHVPDDGVSTVLRNG